MTVSVTSDLSTITLCESGADTGTHYRLNGTSNANPAYDNDAKAEGGYCIANKLGATTGATDVGGHFNHTSTFDLSGKNLYWWQQFVTPGNMATKASGGMQIGLTNTSHKRGRRARERDDALFLFKP